MHGPPLFVNRVSLEQCMQALNHGHHVYKSDKTYTQPPAKPNRIGNSFRTYPEVTSDEYISSEEFTHKTPGRLSMTVGWTQQDELKQSRSRADEPYQYDQMSD